MKPKVSSQSPRMTSAERKSQLHWSFGSQANGIIVGGSVWMLSNGQGGNWQPSCGSRWSINPQPQSSVSLLQKDLIDAAHKLWHSWMELYRTMFEGIVQPTISVQTPCTMPTPSWIPQSPKLSKSRSTQKHLNETTWIGIWILANQKQQINSVSDCDSLSRGNRILP